MSPRNAVSVSDDNNNIKDVKKTKYKVQLVWKNVIGMTILHIGAVYGYYLGATGAGSIGAFVYMFIVNLFGAFSILAGAHRLWAHRSYKAKLPLRIFLAIFQTAAMQNDIYEWCRDHRVHHKFSETDADPHNSKRGFFFAHMGWLLCKKHPDVIEKGKSVDMSDLLQDPVVRFQHKFYIPLVILFRGVIFMMIPMYLLNETYDKAIFANIACYITTLHQTWLVNSAAHLFGNQPYDKTIDPRENKGVVYLSMGEGYHNYHHTFPWDYSASEHGWRGNFNPATAFIDFMAWCGQVTDRKMPKHELIMKRVQRTGETAILPKTISGFRYLLDFLIGMFTATWSIWFIFGMRAILVK